MRRGRRGRQPCQTGSVGLRLWSVAAVAALLFATGCGDSKESGSVEPPPAIGPAPFSLWLSSSRVTDREPVELFAAIVNHDGTNAVFGVLATIDRWDGASWVAHRRIAMCLDHWFCTSEPRELSGELAVPTIGLSPRRDLPVMTGRFTTKGLTRGWYRISHQANEGMMASGIIEITPDAEAIAPLPPIDQPMIAVAPVFVPPTGARVQLSPLVKTASTMDDLERAVAGLAGSATIEHWVAHEWVAVQEMPLRLSRAPIEWAGEVPPLSEGEYRLVRRGPNGDHTGRFWVDDLTA